jgi:protein-tyrosine phosphatase
LTHPEAEPILNEMAAESVVRVLMVCTGNTCRSPMAAAALELALGMERDRLDVQSAGTSAHPGQPATPLAIDLCRAAGVDLTAHRSRRISPALLAQADLILVMEPDHLRAVLGMGADPRKSHVLSDWPAPGEPELRISDPFGASREAYEECWLRIRRHIERVVPQVREALRARSA